MSGTPTTTTTTKGTKMPLSTTLSNGTTVINHATYQASLKTKTIAELRYTIQDAKAAMTAMPEGHKSGYYADEVSYCTMEITLRQKG